ncbi:DUF502 domain-containing protein [Porticoccus sp.]|uniref:DUF502 domain-containing protein n=1 Tax=Porticoccus sp. TaxID=2024853 RepID=UPI000C686C1C|nr:DUF502 domain-containing protein [Porticoccus sp.]MAZ69243.1 hypothetical protein [Porticoccus sp.]|tara:strand:- start:9241 stop:9891 length:651 start_codon:yes stop_codon:yes gene_type:complete
MTRFRSFLCLTLLGGLTVVLPIALLAMIFLWLFDLVAGLISPLTGLLREQATISEFLALLVVLLLILGSCFAVGLLIRTRLGNWMHGHMEIWLTRLAPGYRTIRAIVTQLLGGSGETTLLSGQTALAKIYGADSPVTVTAIVTSRHGDGAYTVFVPTAPIPTSGMTYHLPADCVQILAHVSVEEAMRTIIACGSGSAEMLVRNAREASEKVRDYEE